MPAVDKMQRDVDAIAKHQAGDSKVLNTVYSKQEEASKAVDKMAGTVGDTHDRLLEVKDYSKDTLDELEHVLEKIGKVQKITEQGGDHGGLTKAIHKFEDRAVGYLQEIDRKSEYLLKNQNQNKGPVGMSARDRLEPRMNPNHRGFGFRGGYGRGGGGGNHLGYERDFRGGRGGSGMRRPSSPEEYHHRRSRSASNRSKTRSRSRSRSRSAKRSRSGSSSGSGGGKSGGTSRYRIWGEPMP